MQKSSILLSPIDSFLAMAFTVTSLVALIAPTAHAFDEFRTFRPNEVSFEGSLQYFQATGNYNDSGNLNTQISGTNFKITDGTLGARYVAFPRFGAFLSADFASSQSNDTIQTRNNSGLASATAGVDYLLWTHKNKALWPEFTFKYPFHRVDYSANGVLNDEGDMEATGRLVGRARWGSFDSFASLGYRYRDEGRASLLPFSVGAEIPLSVVKIGGELSGYQTLVKDSGTNGIYSRDAVASRDGDSLYFDSINPARLDLNAWLRWSGDPYQVKVGGGTTLTGANTAGGWWAFVGVQIQFVAVERSSSPSAPTNSRILAPTPDGRNFNSKEFQEDIDNNVDQSLFNDSTPSTPVPPASSAPMLEESTTPVVRPKNPTRRERLQMQREQQQKLQNELDDTEMQIELKSKKDRGSGNGD
jgi:hypothetical protein